MSEPADDPSVRSIVRWGPWALLAVSVAVMLLGAWLRRHTLDDAFINYRIVHQIRAGNGPVFNAGERVEAFTSPLWLAMLTLGDIILPIKLEWIGMVGGILAGAVGLGFIGFGSRTLHDDVATPDRVLLPLGALSLAAFPPIYRLVGGGLEDGITVAWLGACLWVLGRWSRSGKRLGLPSAVLLGLGVLVRPDLAPFTATFLIAVIIGDRIGDRAAGLRRNVAMVAAAAALPVLSEVLRMGYFGVLTPNTAIAKSADLARWGWGWHYFLDTVVPYGFWVPAVILVAMGYVPLLRGWSGDDKQRRRALVAAAFGAGALACTLYIIRMGGDYMQARLLLGAIVGFVAPVAFVPIPRRPATRPTVAGAIAGAVALSLWIIVVGLFVRTSSDNVAVLFEARNAVTLADFQATSAARLAPAATPGSVFYGYIRLPYPSARGETPVLIEFGVGKVAYASPTDVYVLDVLGLANPIAGHQQLRVRGWPGHEKLLTQPWIAALSTAPGSPVQESSFPRPPRIRAKNLSVTFPNQGDAQGRSFPTRVATARAVLGCNRMERFRASYEAPLTARRFARNLLSAPSNQRLVVSGEPAVAARMLCTAQEQAHIPGLH